MLIISCPNCERFGCYINRVGSGDFTFWIECDACKTKGASAQQPAPSIKRSAKTVGSSRNEPRDVVPQEVEEPSVNAVSIDELELSVRSYNALTNAGIKTIGDIRKLKESDLLQIKNLGRLSFEQIRTAVETYCFNYGITKAGEADRY
jgi:DNA-directed RNA polymerase alpha subunit